MALSAEHAAKLKAQAAKAKQDKASKQKTLLAKLQRKKKLDIGDLYTPSDNPYAPLIEEAAHLIMNPVVPDEPKPGQFQVSSDAFIHVLYS